MRQSMTYEGHITVDMPINYKCSPVHAFASSPLQYCGSKPDECYSTYSCYFLDPKFLPCPFFHFLVENEAVVVYEMSSFLAAYGFKF